jgi:hypothetical protein
MTVKRTYTEADALTKETHKALATLFFSVTQEVSLGKRVAACFFSP